MMYRLYGDASKLVNESGDSPLYSSLLGQAKTVDPCQLLSDCQMDDLLDEGESYADFVSCDEDARCYLSETGDEKVYFIQLMGNEFFFTVDGQIPVEYVDSYESVHREMSWDGLAVTLLPGNCALSAGRYLDEPDAQTIGPNVEVIEGEPMRFRLFRDGKAVAGLSVLNGMVEALYVSPDYRRQGLGTDLFNQARNWLGELEHSATLTESGLLFRQSFDDKQDERALDPSMCTDDGPAW